MPAVAGVDSSTQSTKVLVVDLEDGAVLAAGHAPHPATDPPCSEQDPAAWWAALEQAWSACGAVTGDVVAISIAGQQHGMVALDGAGEPVHRAKLWNDTEAAPQAERLVAEFGARALADRVGSVPGAAFTLPKVAWLREERPDEFARVARVLLPHEWLTWELLGRPAVAATDRGDASGSGWWSPARGAADLELLAWAGADPAWVATVATPHARLGESAALSPGLGVAPGTGDNMGAALGLGLASGELALSFGTSGTAFVVADAPTADASGVVAGFADATGRFLPLVCTANAMRVTDWVLALGGRSHDDLDDVVAVGERSAVAVLPYLDGERTPYRPHATAQIVGVTGRTDLAAIARAAVDAVVSSLLDGADRLGEHAGPIRLVGGGARSEAYRQAVADLAQRPVLHSPREPEWVAYGAAVQAAATWRGVPPTEVVADWTPVTFERTDPRLSTAEATGVRERYRTLVSSAAKP